MIRHLFMRRPDLDDLPSLPPLPPGYILREFRSQDLDALSNMMRLAFEDDQWTSERMKRVLTEAADVKKVFVVDFGGLPVASASARVMPEEHPGSGYVHWVAVAPAHRNKGLGYLVTLATLYEFKQMGLRDAVLETDDHRLAAIKTYQKLGFEPENRHDSHIERWAIVISNLLNAANL
jgi:mycothiol synthase